VTQRSIPWLLLAAAALGLLWWLLDASVPPAPPGASSRGDAGDAPSAGPALGVRPAPSADAGVSGGGEDGRDAKGVAHAWVRVEGRVIDARRRPVPGAEVALLLAGVPRARTTTEAEGRYRFEHDLGPGPEAPGGARGNAALPPLLLSATAPDGAAGTRPAFRAPPGRDTFWPAQPIQVLKAQALDVLVRAGGAPVAGARVRLAHRGKDRAAQPVWVATGQTGADGRWSSPGLPAGTASAWVDAPGFALAVATAALPPEEPGPLVVDLAPPRPLRVRVLEAGTGTPVPDATIEMSVWPPSPAVVEPALSTFPCGVTDAGGSCTVARPASGLRTFLRAAAPGRPRRWMAQRDNVEAPEDAEEALLEVLAPAALRWAIAQGEGELPLDGTRVRILDAREAFEAEGYALPEHGRIEEGHLVVPDAVPSAHVDLALLAVLPDGRAAHARLPKGESEGEAVRFVSTRRIRVSVRDPEGRPSAGLGVTTSGQPQELRNALRTFTGADGTCTLEPLLPLRTTVRVYGAFQSLGRVEQAVDLLAGDGVADFVLPAPRTLRVLVRVDGRPELPGEWTLVLGDRTHVDDRLVEEDPAHGEILVRVHAERDLAGTRARFEAPGLPAATSGIEAAQGESRVAFDLATGGLLVVTVRPPQDGRYELRLERHVPEAEGWLDWAPPVPPSAEGQVWRFGPLEAWRWRVRDALSGLASEAVELDPARGAQGLALDLSSVFEVRGRVKAPPGTELGWVRVLGAGAPEDRGRLPAVEVIGPGAPRPAPFEEPPGGLRVADDGSFTARAGTGEPLELRAWHPLLGTSEVVRVGAPRSEVLLRLAPSPTVHLLFAAPDPAAPAPAPGARRAVLLRGGVEVFSARPVREIGGVRFGGFEPGTYDLWVDGGQRAPLLLGAVTLGEGETTVPDARFPLGAALRVEVRSRDGGTERFLGVTARHLGVPAYERSTVLRPGHEARLGGLGPGRFAVTVREMMGAGRVLAEREVESDGEGEQTLVVEAP
jgi:hypothetical protein